MRRLTPNHAAERDHTGIAARLRERHRRQRQLERSRYRHDRDRVGRDARLFELLERALKQIVRDLAVEAADDDADRAAPADGRTLQQGVPVRNVQLAHRVLDGRGLLGIGFLRRELLGRLELCLLHLLGGSEHGPRRLRLDRIRRRRLFDEWLCLQVEVPLGFVLHLGLGLRLGLGIRLRRPVRGGRSLPVGPTLGIVVVARQLSSESRSNFRS